MNQETKLGLFVLVGIVGLLVTIILLGDFQFQGRYHLNILFSDIAGLPDKAKVKIAGVEIGAVKEISLEGNKAKVMVWIKRNVKIHSDAKASIVSTGLIGSKYLELTIGSEDAPVLKDGDVIVGVDPLSFDKVVQDVMEQLDAITKPFKGKTGKNIGDNLAKTLENMREVTDTLRVTLYAQEQDLKEIVRDFHTFTRNMAEISQDDLKVAVSSIRNISEKLDRILDKIDKGEGALGRLMTDKEMGEDIKEAFKDLKETSNEAKKVLGKITLIETHWDYSLRYDGKYDLFRNDAGIRIYPRKDKFYYVGVSNISDDSATTTDPEETNTLNFLIGKHFGPAQLYGGLYRKTAGVGMKVKPLWKWEPWRRLEIVADGYDFSRRTPVHTPKVNLGLRLELMKWAYIGSQIEDPAYESNVNTYMNLVIRDDDIAYILGLVGLAR
ncbi:MAG: MCE family protein [Endomicrobiales bacterium]|nr:MCE family protein [Endomicrobiales bacterium]